MILHNFREGIDEVGSDTEAVVVYVVQKKFDWKGIDKGTIN
jgi:hypothetical protein